jgi:hypothetical protein
MNRQSAAGPSGIASWESRQAGAAERPLPILVLPDAGRPDLSYVLPQVPQLARDSADRPVFSLSLVLSRRPGPEDASIFPLIQSGSVAFDLTLGLPDDVLNDTVLLLFARRADFWLVKRTSESGEPALAETTGSGAGVRVGLGAQLGQAAAQGVLVALQSGESGLSLACRVTYRTAESRLVIHLYVRWAAVYDYLNAHVDRSGSFSRVSLQGHLLVMVRNGALKAWRVKPNGLETDLTEAEAPALLEAFLKVGGTLLKSATPGLDPADPAIRYTLRARPDEAFSLDLHLSVTTANEASKDLDAPLEAVIGGALEGQDAEGFIHLTYVDPGSRGGMQPVPRRMRSGPPTRDFPEGGRGVPSDLAAVEGNVVSMTRALTPDSTLRPAAYTLLASDAVRLHAWPAQAFVVDNLAVGRINDGFVDPGDLDPSLHLPSVDDPGAALWVDSEDLSRFWYPPEFSLVQPDPSGDPDSSPFQLTFHEAGHDSQGRPVLEGEAMFTLRRGISAATQAALQARGNPLAQPVRTIGLSVVLSLPVRDSSGQLRQIDLPASVDDHGETIAARVALLNEYVRVAYGDLAIAGFQPNRAQLKVAYTFEAMVPAQEVNLRLQYAGKIAQTLVVYTPVQPGEFGGRPYMDASRVAYRSPAADLVFRREAPLAAFGNGRKSGPSAPGTPPPVRSSQVPRPVNSMVINAVALNTTATQPKLETMAIAHSGIVGATPVRPEMESAIRLQDLLKRRRSAWQILGRSAALDAFFPCTSLGVFYRQDLGDRMTSIGCQDSFSLGQTAFKLYELIDDAALASPLYNVYRSLSQPGRFLILPSIYRITRYAPSEGERAYRPAVYLYSSLDAENEANNRCVVMATLQPDLSPWVRKDLEGKLARLHHSPVMQYITEIDSQLTYTWSLSGGSASIQPQAAKLWDSFQVTLSTDLAGGLQLQAMLAHSGVSAGVSFKLADGTILQSSLVLDLTGLTGPWAGGPLETALHGTKATLTNHIERGVNVSDLEAYAADRSSQAVRVDRLLAAGESATIDLPFEAAEAYPVYTLQPGGPADLTEISSFVENIHTNVVFVNLISYANHNLKRLDLRARLKEAPGSETDVPISEDQPVGEAAFILPLTTYLGARTLQFQVTKTDNSDAVTATAWLEWDLTTLGNVVSLTWSLIT